MKGYSVYHSIKQLKEQGFKKAAVARRLGINRRTVDRYWDMAVDDYQELHKKVKRRQSLDEYKDAILGWIHDHPDISAAQICDWLKENYDQAFSGRTVSRYVKELRETNNLRKHPNARTYEAVPELPMGMQVQADFGEKYLSTATGAWVKVFSSSHVQDICMPSSRPDRSRLPILLQHAAAVSTTLAECRARWSLTRTASFA